MIDLSLNYERNIDLDILYDEIIIILLIYEEEIKKAYEIRRNEILLFFIKIRDYKQVEIR